MLIQKRLTKCIEYSSTFNVTWSKQLHYDNPDLAWISIMNVLTISIKKAQLVLERWLDLEYRCVITRALQSKQCYELSQMPIAKDIVGHYRYSLK